MLNVVLVPLAYLATFLIGCLAIASLVFFMPLDNTKNVPSLSTANHDKSSPCFYADFYSVSPQYYQNWFLPIINQPIDSLISVHIKGFLFDEISIDQFASFLLINPTITSLTLEECNLNEFFLKKLNLQKLESFEMLGGSCHEKFLESIVESLSPSLRILKIHCDYFDIVKDSDFISLTKFNNLQCLSLISIRASHCNFLDMIRSITSNDLTELRISNSKSTVGDIQLEGLNLKSLKVLDLSQNYFRPDHLRDVFRNIKSVPLLEELNLEYCNIKCFSEFSFITAERFPSLKRLFIIQQEISEIIFEESVFSPSKLNLTSLSIGIHLQEYRNNLLSSLYSMKGLEYITIKTSLPQTPQSNNPVWSLRSNELRHFSINENVFNCLIGWNYVSFRNLTSLSVECNTLSSELSSFLNYIFSFSSLSEFSIKINQYSTTGTENYVQLALSLGKLTTLKKLHVNLMNFKDFYVTILSGKCVEKMEHLKITVGRNLLDLSADDFFLLLLRFSNLKSLSVEIFKRGVKEIITAKEFASLQTSKVSSFTKLEKFFINFNCAEFTKIHSFGTILKLMPKLASFELVTMDPGVWRDLFNFNQTLPIRFMSITSGYQIEDYYYLLWKKQHYLPFLTSLTIELGTTGRIFCCKDFIYSISLLKAISNVEESAKFPTLTFTDDAFFFMAMIKCKENGSMLVQKSDRLMQHFSFFFSSQQRYEILKSISEREWTKIADLLNNRSDNVFSWRKFCLTIEFCQTLGYSLEELSENLNISDLNFLGRLLFNAEYNFTDYDSTGAGFLFSDDSILENPRFNFVYTIAFKDFSYYISPKDISEKVEHILWTFFSNESPIDQSIDIDAESFVQYMYLYRVLFGINVNRLLDHLKNDTLPAKTASIIKTICGRPFHETNNYRVLKSKQIENLHVILNRKMYIENEYSKSTLIFDRLKMIFEDKTIAESTIEITECSICMNDENEERYLFLPFKNDDGSIEYCHHYHKSCILTWIKEHKNCPFCRRELAGSYREFLE